MIRFLRWCDLLVDLETIRVLLCARNVFPHSGEFRRRWSVQCLCQCQVRSLFFTEVWWIGNSDRLPSATSTHPKQLANFFVVINICTYLQVRNYHIFRLHRRCKLHDWSSVFLALPNQYRDPKMAKKVESYLKFWWFTSDGVLFQGHLMMNTG